MEEMVEPDRTILIVSIIGLVIIWGSVLYHKFVQGGGAADGQAGPAVAAQGEPPAAGEEAPAATVPPAGGEDRRSRKKGRKNR